MRCDAVIFGGGVAGLWLLDALRRKGCSAILLESDSLGRGQTVASQGIIHGGLKYTLQGLLTRSAENISAMPALWRDCLAGRTSPDLSHTRLRSEFCYLWRTDSLRSRLGMIGARFGLQVAPKNLSREERPEVLASCPGTVARLDEQVLSPASLLQNLQALQRDAILHYDRDSLAIHRTHSGTIERIDLKAFSGDAGLDLKPRFVIFAAGAGNAVLRVAGGLSHTAMQRRPLHMLMLRGDLPELNGHCVDGARTRATITTDRTAAGDCLWQVGGQLAEVGVALDRAALIARGQDELRAVLPGIDLDRAAWGTYRVDRAERAMPGGKRPETFEILKEANLVTLWPTKLVLAPVVASRIASEIEPACDDVVRELTDWPKPAVATPPWEDASAWSANESPLPRVA